MTTLKTIPELEVELARQNGQFEQLFADLRSLDSVDFQVPAEMLEEIDRLTASPRASVSFPHCGVRA